MRSRRHPLPDVLRALALLGVIVVNAAGYASAPLGPILGPGEPAGEGLTWAVQGLQAWLLQGKAYPALAFLFGWGLAMSMKPVEPSTLEQARRRQWRMLLLGVLHGTLLYFGDILTLYALCGFWVMSAVRARWAILRRRLRRTAWWALGTTLFFMVVGALIPAPPPGEPGFADVTSVGQFLEMNVFAFVITAVPSLLLGAPVIVLCMLVGVAAARLRLLTHARWAFWRRLQVRRWLVALLLWNLLYAALLVASSQNSSEASLWLDSATPLFGLPLAAVGILALAQARADGRLTWAEWLAPLGRRTLTVYVGHAGWCVLLFSGIGLNWQPGAVGILAASVGFWLLASWAASHSERRWPLEAWMGRRA